MKPMEQSLVDELLQQHEQLRALIDRCEQLADAFDAGRAAPDVLTREVAQLRAAFDAHNRFEEQLPRAVLHVGDDHASEHRALRGQLDGPTAELRAALAGLREHLAAEERYFCVA